MNADLKDIYRMTVLDHSRHPHNFRRLDPADRVAEGHNPLCGDKVTIYLDLDDDRIRDIGFEGTGCAICIASASMMTDAVQSTSIAEADQAIDRFTGMLTTAGGDEAIDPDMDQLRALAGVRAYPSRVKCATLPWHALRAAMRSEPGTVNTEQEDPGVRPR